MLTDKTLQDHKKMFTLGHDLDTWLQSSEAMPDLEVDQLVNLQAMRTLFTEVRKGDLTSFEILQDTEALQAWIKIWATEHDTPE